MKRRLIITLGIISIIFLFIEISLYVLSAGGSIPFIFSTIPLTIVTILLLIKIIQKKEANSIKIKIFFITLAILTILSIIGSIHFMTMDDYYPYPNKCLAEGGNCVEECRSGFEINNRLNGCKENEVCCLTEGIIFR